MGAVYRKQCDQCHTEFKRGLRMDMLINEVSMLSGALHWDPRNDIEHFACFCGKECLLSYVAQQLGVEEDEVPIPSISETADQSLRQ